MGFLDRITDMFGGSDPKPEPKPGEIKPGILTTEWWVTVAGVVLSALVSLGLLNSGDSAEISALIAKIVGAVVSLVAGIMAIMRYVDARTDLKSTSVEILVMPKKEDDDEDSPEFP